MKYNTYTKKDLANVAEYLSKKFNLKFGIVSSIYLKNEKIITLDDVPIFTGRNKDIMQIPLSIEKIEENGYEIKLLKK